MAVKAGVSEEEYLRTSFEGLDREYVDGEIVERSLPDNLHSKTQMRLCVLFALLGERLPLYTRPELRVKVGKRRYRIPDLSIFAYDEPVEAVPSGPPWIAIEILSVDDRNLEEKLREYRDWGVRHIWAVDPRRRKIHVYGEALQEVPSYRLPEFGVEIAASEIFR